MISFLLSETKSRLLLFRYASRKRACDKVVKVTGWCAGKDGGRDVWPQLRAFLFSASVDSKRFGFNNIYFNSLKQYPSLCRFLLLVVFTIHHFTLNIVFSCFFFLFFLTLSYTRNSVSTP